METDTAPEILDREKRKQIWFELVVVLALIWVAVAYAGLQEFLSLSRPRVTVQSEIYGVFHRLAEGLLPVVLFLRAREPLAKLGLRRLTDKDVRLAAGLIVFLVLYHFGLTLYRPLFLHSPDAYTHVSIKGIGPVWV